ncbi:D-aminoacyl-tRNA deacylase [Halorientalis regularis]|jgi:D-aminoacyl-tRNA deacylase|uniref:D-aminoacyl-tRNA deacylase n=1 Tax=Halorientalis regularis TaxID=660518 RepID=A0A1G7ILU3_9EURY|nr:D-aminoacyl-tRNA deacylase [Halorientalis regularis]SDF13700.1 D-aminoacyl-tRNA deacylase [Halorientalis regularis]
MLGIVVSRADRASEHVGDRLRDLVDWSPVDAPDHPDAAGPVYRTDGAQLREFDAWHLHLNDAADAFPAELDLLVFASRHSGETGPLLTAHHTGNFGPAEHGGEDDALARACPNAHSRVLDALATHAPEDYEVGMECTHHGPTDVGVPSMFVEVGSGDPQWDDPAAAEAVARAILDLRGVAPDADLEPASAEVAGTGADTVRRHLVGFGGGHYAPRFERIVRETDWAVGHLAADWGLDAMGDPAANRDLLDAAFTESAATHAVVDGDHPDLRDEIAALGYRVVGETWLRAVTGVPLALAARLEDTLVPVEDGLRFGEPASESSPDAEFETVSLPEDLLDRAQGIDQKRTRDLLAAHALAFETEENGNRVAGRAAVASRGDYTTVIDGIVDLLRTAYDAVERREDAVIAREETFDPGKAKTLGVPEGPKFGRLSAGEPVEVDGTTIPPDRVRSEREDRFSL